MVTIGTVWHCIRFYFPTSTTHKIVDMLQDTIMGANNSSFTAHGHPGGLNMLPTRAMPDMYNHPPFPNASPMRPSPRMLGQQDFSSISSVEAYRQHHEVSAMVSDSFFTIFLTFYCCPFLHTWLCSLLYAGVSISLVETFKFAISSLILLKSNFIPNWRFQMHKFNGEKIICTQLSTF